jgi:hypothetical protein
MHLCSIDIHNKIECENDIHTLTTQPLKTNTKKGDAKTDEVVLVKYDNPHANYSLGIGGP